MGIIASHRTIIIACMYIGLKAIVPDSARAQQRAASDTAVPAQPDDLRALAGLVREMEGEMRMLNCQLSDLRTAQQNSNAETTQLRGKVSALENQLANLANVSHKQLEQVVYARQKDPGQASYPMPEQDHRPPYAAIEQGKISNISNSVSALAVRDFPQPQNAEDRLSALEERLQLATQEINEQNQTKVESGSKYRLRLSGIILLNLFSNHGVVNNQDFPAIAVPGNPFESTSTFGGSLRQSQIAVQAFGPDIGGAHTSADLRIDFGGGFPLTSNGSTMGIVRLRTGVVRLDWSDTSIVAGQDQLFFAPTNPTSLASLAVPALAYAGNLWAWVPQVRIEHHVDLSDNSRLLVQAGILESLSGEIAESEYVRLPTWGEQSGQPAYATRIAWRRRLFGREMTAGVGGYYGRQYWGLGRNINSWAGTANLTLPLGNRFEFSGEFYRGQAAGGLGGAIGQSVLWNGNFDSPHTTLQALDSIGGWVQLKFRSTPKFEINGAFGDDNPFAAELREYKSNPSYLGFLLSKNLSPFVNFIYEPRSNVVFSTEYRRIKTFPLDASATAANLISLSLGYIF